MSERVGDGYDVALEVICRILREYRRDSDAALEDDDLIFEGDYADKILNHPAVSTVALQDVLDRIKQRLASHEKYDEPWDKGYKVGLRDGLEDIARATPEATS